MENVDEAAPKRKRGRPSKYSKALVEEICERIALGESLRRICADPEMPTLKTLYNWHKREDIKAELLQRFLGARAFQSLVMDGDMQDVADDGRGDITEDEDGEEVVDREHIQRSKLRCDVMWRRMKCMNPEMFAEKLNVAHEGEVALVDRAAVLEEARRRVKEGKSQSDADG